VQSYYQIPPYEVRYTIMYNPTFRAVWGSPLPRSSAAERILLVWTACCRCRCSINHPCQDRPGSGFCDSRFVPVWAKVNKRQNGVCTTVIQWYATAAVSYQIDYLRNLSSSFNYQHLRLPVKQRIDFKLFTSHCMVLLRCTYWMTDNSSRTWDVDISGLPTSHFLSYRLSILLYGCVWQPELNEYVMLCYKRVSCRRHSHRLATGVSL